MKKLEKMVRKEISNGNKSDPAERHEPDRQDLNLGEQSWQK